MPAAIDDLQREVGRLRNDLAELQRESRTNQGVLAGAIRKTRRALTEIEQRRAVARLSQPAGLVNWSPRAGDQANPDMNTSLIDRLRKGQPVADSLGNVAPFFGQTNLLDDPTFERCSGTMIAVGTGSTVIGRSGAAGGWFAFRSATACTATCGVEYERDDAFDNPFNTHALRMGLVISGAGTHTLTLDSDAWAAISIPVLPYLVTAIRASRLFVGTHTNITRKQLILELVDGLPAGAGTVRGSATIDLDDLVPYRGQTQMVAAGLFAGQSYVANNFHLRIRLEVVTTGAASVLYHVGEPQLVMTYSPDPGPFTPLLAGWQAPKLLADGRAATDVIIDSRLGTTDANPRYSVAANGDTKWGDGTATQDVRIKRGAARYLVIDNNGTAGALYVELIGSNATDTGWVLSRTGDTVAPWAITTGNGVNPSMNFGPGNGPRDIYITRQGSGYLKIDSGGAASQTALELQASAGQGVIIGMYAAGDTNYRTTINGFGSAGILFSSGAATADMRFYRGAAGNPVLDANGQAQATNFDVVATAGQRNHVGLYAGGDTVQRVWLEGSATVTGLHFGPGNANLDARFYRSGAKAVTIDDAAGGAATLNVVGIIDINGLQVIQQRVTGWGVPTGTAQRGTFATDTVTLINLARAVKAIKDDLTTHGLLGA